MTSINVRTILIVLLSSLSAIETEITDRRPLKHGYAHNAPDSTVSKVTLTQKGYIQFLQYIADVPTITEFTFCIWIKSVNLTYAHPLLSYSRHDTERLIRSWVTPSGKSLNLEIFENEIFSVPVDLAENRWYHICQSWMSSTGVWVAFVNGQAKAIGINQKMRSLKIPNGGEIVVGQEYTDFDKGLDDGIEGDIYGFNLVLAAASSTTTPLTLPEKPPPIYLHQNDLGLRRQLDLQSTLRHQKPPNIYRGSIPQQFSSHSYEPNYDANLTPPKTSTQLANSEETDVPEVLSYFDTNVNRHPKGLFDFGKGILNMFNVFEAEEPVRIKTPSPKLANIRQAEQVNYAPRHAGYIQDAYNPYNQQLYAPKRFFTANSRLSQQEGELNAKPLGLILVELSYGNCALGKGSPINDKRLLISWTKTPVRVFGGAILKAVAPFCTRETFRVR